MRKIVLLFTVFISFALCALRAEEKAFVFDAAEKEVSLTLDEAVAIALRDSRDILLRIEDVNKAKERLAESKAGLLPTLNFTGGWTYSKNLYPQGLGQTATQFTLKQYLYKGGETINTIKYNGYNLEVTQAVLDKAKLDLVLNVQNAFYTLSLAEEFTELNKYILYNAKAHLEVEEARYQSGEASESDILAIKESLSATEEAYEESLNQVEAASGLLKNLLYLDDKVRIRPQAQLSYEPRDIAYDEAFLKAMKTRPEIRQYEALQEANKKAVEMAKSKGRPNIYASWDYYSRSTTSLTFMPSKGWQDYNIIGITFSWPMFDGWLTKARIEQAIVDLRQTRLTKEKTVKDIALELKNAYLDLKDAVSKIKTAESEIAAYSDNLSVIKLKYDDGIASLLDLEDANLRYSISKFNKIQAAYDYIIAKANFDKATGGI
ncbi:MAG: TolC family protein [Candidatus Omnitrophota bacterium]